MCFNNRSENVGLGFHEEGIRAGTPSVVHPESMISLPTEENPPGR